MKIVTKGICLFLRRPFQILCTIVHIVQSYLAQYMRHRKLNAMEQHTSINNKNCKFLEEEDKILKMNILKNK
jgi:hypothetical protein